jgi:hypothetical protein
MFPRNLPTLSSEEEKNPSEGKSNDRREKQALGLKPK